MEAVPDTGGAERPRLLARSLRPVLCFGEQLMHAIQPTDDLPVWWQPQRCPSVEEGRPHQCPRCKRPAHWHGRVVLHGHGVRERGVVVPPALAGRSRPALTTCWARRYRCTSCGCVTTVQPRGVMPRYLYSALAIVVAFILVAEAPYGDELTDALAYRRQGLNAVHRYHRWVDWRWRSLNRWRARIQAWWPGLSDDLRGWLAGLHRRAGSHDRRALLAAAVASHASWGAAM